MTYTIPLGALLAAEHAYEQLGEDERRDSALVAELLLQAAAPFSGPIAAQLGRGRVNEKASREIFSKYLCGTSVAVLADLYAVTAPTIRKHLVRRARTALVRHQSGVSVSVLARESGCTPAALTNELERQASCDGDSRTKAEGVPMPGADQPGAMGGRHLRSDSGRRRPGPGRIPAHHR